VVVHVPVCVRACVPQGGGGVNQGAQNTVESVRQLKLYVEKGESLTGAVVSAVETFAELSAHGANASLSTLVSVAARSATRGYASARRERVSGS
jgi:hypothetical protein